MERKARKALRKRLERNTGRVNEDRLVNLLNRHAHKRLPWFIHARHASLKEDIAKGTDVVVETEDVGEIRVQVKPSRKLANRFRESRRDGCRDMAVVIVCREMRDRSILHFACWELRVIRMRRLMPKLS